MITYAGVKLNIATTEVAEAIEQLISPRDVYQWQRQTWPGSTRQVWTWPLPGPTQNRPIKVGTLYWPTGASRFAVAHFLVTEERLASIRAATYANDQYQAKDLVLTQYNQDNDLIQSVTAPMWMLPARPLFQVPDPDFRHLYLLTLVDDRYFWWQKNTGELVVDEGTTTWANLYSSLATQLGTSITVDSIPAAYLKPSAGLTSYYQPCAHLLDVVAYNVGHRIVRKLDGTVLAQNVVNAKSQASTNYAAATRIIAGGYFALAAGSDNDLPGVLPESVQVIFQKAEDGVVQNDDAYVETSTLASLALSDFSGAITNTSVKTFHDAATACYVSGSLTNASELSALVDQIATDWYRYQVCDADVKIVGVFPWVPEGWTDHIEWVYRFNRQLAKIEFNDVDEEVSTRVQRWPFNDLADEGMHAGTCSPPSSVPSPGPGPGPGPGGGGCSNVTRTVVDMVRTDGCNVVSRERKIRWPCGDLISTTTKISPVCSPATATIIIGIIILDGDLYIKYQDYDVPSWQPRGPSYCVVNPPVDCSSSSGSGTFCLDGCYEVLIGIGGENNCSDCDNFNQVLELTEDGCDQTARVEICGIERLIRVRDNGPKIILEVLAGLDSPEVIATYSVNDGDFDPDGVTVLFKDFGDDDLCDWGAAAILQPCGLSSSGNSNSGSGQGPLPPLGGCACDTSNVQRWSLTIGAPSDYQCGCDVFGCTFCLECSHDPYTLEQLGGDLLSASTPGAIYGGTYGFDGDAADLGCNGTNPNEPSKRCLWTDWVRSREHGGSAPGDFDGCRDNGQYIIALRASTTGDFWILTVEKARKTQQGVGPVGDAGEPAEVVVRYAAFPPTTCDFLDEGGYMTMYYMEDDGVSCNNLPQPPGGIVGDWPAEIKLYPNGCACTPAACSATCGPTVRWNIPGFTTVRSDVCEDDCIALRQPLCLTGGDGCTWNDTVSFGCDTDQTVSVTLTDSGNCWVLTVGRATVQDPNHAMARYEGTKPGACANGQTVTFTLVEVLDNKCTDWPCEVIATAFVPQECPGCDCDCASGNAPPAKWTFSGLSLTNDPGSTCIPPGPSCAGGGTAWFDPGTGLVKESTITGSNNCKWVYAAVATICSDPPACAGTGVSLSYSAVTKKWTLAFHGVCGAVTEPHGWNEPIAMTYTLNECDFNCNASNVMVAGTPTGAAAHCVWPATITLTVVP